MGKGNKQQLHFLRSEIDLFSDVGYDMSIVNSYKTFYHPQNNLSDRGAPLSFFIPGNDTHYNEYYDSSIYLRCKIVNGAKSPPEDFTPEDCADVSKFAYAPVNNLGHSMFESVVVKYKDNEVTHKNSYYAYRAYMEKLLSFGKQFLKTQGQLAFYQKNLDETKTNDPGWNERFAKSTKSQEFEMIIRPHTELFNQSKFFIPGVDVRIDLHRAADEFCIQTCGTERANYKPQLKILEAKLKIQKHALLPSVALNHIKMWNSGNNVVYPQREVEMKTYAIPVGQLQHTNETMLTGFLPDRIVLALVASKNLHGSYDTNPFVFTNFDISNITVSMNGENHVTDSMDLDFKNKRFLEAYMTLFEGLGLANCDTCNDITADMYLCGKTMFAYDFRNVRDAFYPPRHGNISIRLRFKEPLPESINVMCYAEYQSVLYINSDKQVFKKDFSKEF
jgi:hypothetical protein